MPLVFGKSRIPCILWIKKLEMAGGSMSDRLVFSTRRYSYLRDLVCSTQHFKAGKLERKVFPDGELYQRIDESVNAQEVFLLGGTGSDHETMELFDLACGLVYCGAISLTVIIPYFGYSTMERASLPGEVIPAKNRALLLSAIPKARLGNEFVFFDLHTQGVPHYLEGSIRLAQLSARGFVAEVLREFGDGVILASTDAGRAKWVESLANAVGVEAAFVYKQRLTGTETRITGVNAHVEDRTVVIYDDMIRTGGSMVQAARAYLENGAKEVVAFTSHGVFPGDTLKNMKSTGLFRWVGCCNTHPRAVELASEEPLVDPFLRIFDISPVILDFMRHDSE